MRYPGKKLIRKIEITRTFYQVVRTGSSFYFDRDSKTPGNKIASFESGAAVVKVLEEPRELTLVEETMLTQTRRDDEEADFERTDNEVP